MSRSIAMFLPSLAGGGAERVMTYLANAFSELGHQVDMVLVQAEGPNLSKLSAGVRLVDLNARRTTTSVAALVNYLRSQRPVSLLTTLNHTSIVALVGKQISGVDTRVVVRLANVLSMSFTQTRRRRARVLIPPLVKRLYRRADRIIAVSRGVADDAMRFGSLRPDQVVTVNNPAFIDHVTRLADEPIDHPWFAPGEPPVVLAVGRLTNQKDFPTLIRAFAKVRQRREARLLILGEGEKRKELENLVRENRLSSCVDLPGFENNPYKYMAHSELFVLSSRWEGFPNVLLEAMSIGVPIVATDCVAGPEEILDGGRFGRLVPVGEHELMANAIVAELDARTCSQATLKERARDFSPEAVVKRYLEVLLES